MTRFENRGRAVTERSLRLRDHANQQRRIRVGFRANEQAREEFRIVVGVAERMNVLADFAGRVGFLQFECVIVWFAADGDVEVTAGLLRGVQFQFCEGVMRDLQLPVDFFGIAFRLFVVTSSAIPTS